MASKQKSKSCLNCERYRVVLKKCLDALGSVPQGVDIFQAGCMKKVIEAFNEAEQVLYYEK